MFLTGIIAIFLAAGHLTGSKLTFLGRIPRSRWLSLAGGISVGYVFVHLLPELSENQRRLEEAVRGSALELLESHIYVVALLGLAVFYGLESAARSSKKGSPGADADTKSPGFIFWLHIGSFAVYNGLIGYLLASRREDDLGGVLMFALAMGLHFVVNDFGLREHHPKRYDKSGRWVLAAAILGGWGFAQLFTVSEAFLAILFALIAGGVVLNVLKEELPEERESSFIPFALGAFGYTALLLLI